MAEQNRLDRFMMDDDELDGMIEYGEAESRCELCDHYLGKNDLTYGERVCNAYQKGKVIPDRIWDEDNLHAKKLIETVERLYITVATIPFDTFSEGVHRQMVHHLGKYIFA